MQSYVNNEIKMDNSTQESDIETETSNDSIKEIAKKDCIIITLEDQLKEKSSALETACKSVQYFIKNQKKMENELDELRLKLKVTADGAPQEVLSSHQSIVEKLKSELNVCREDAEEAHLCRQDYANMCGILTARLKELAEFLNSLLKHNEILGLLSEDRRHTIQDAINKSLDLSNSLNNNSLSMTGRFSMNESNFNNISSLSDILNFSLDNKENLPNSVFKYQERIAELELLIAERDQQILKTKTLVDEENHANVDLENYKKENEILGIEIEKFKTKVQHDAAELERLKSLLDEKILDVEILTAECDASKSQLDAATTKLNAFQTHLEEMKNLHDHEVNDIMQKHANEMKACKEDLNEKFLSQIKKILECDPFSDRLDHTNPSPHSDIATVPFTPQLEKVTSALENLMLKEDEEAYQNTPTNEASAHAHNESIVTHNCVEVDKENAKLKHKVMVLDKAYTNILAHLKLSKNRKEQVDREIRREIRKTQDVLENVGPNIESVTKNSPNERKFE